MLSLARVAALAALLPFPAFAQNPLQHYPPGTGFSSRGTAGTQATTLLQRLPADQVCGRTTVHSLTYAIQDTDPAAGIGQWAVELRRNDSAGPPTGAPDMTTGGLIMSLPVSFDFGTGVIAYNITTTPTTPIGLAPTMSMPQSDVYVGLALGTVVPGVNLSMHMALDASGRPGAVGYTGVAGVIGLGWEAVGGANPGLFQNTTAWNITTRFVDEILQVFVENATFSQPHFGYASLFPDVPGRDDRFGARMIAQGNPGDVGILLVGLPESVPIVHPGVGTRCLMTNSLPIDARVFHRFDLQTTVVATFGPFTGIRGRNDLHLQAVSFKIGGFIRLSTSCKVDF